MTARPFEKVVAAAVATIHELPGGTELVRPGLGGSHLFQREHPINHTKPRNGIGKR